MKKAHLLPIVLLVLTACPYGYRYDTGHFQESVTNFGEVNSLYDDYNMTAPFISGKTGFSLLLASIFGQIWYGM